MWYVDETRLRKWDNNKDKPRPPFGDEEKSWNKVRVEYRKKTRENLVHIFKNNQWIQIGTTKTFYKHFSHIELKIDRDITGANVKMEIDNVRLYPRDIWTIEFEKIPHVIMD